jgi:hypothetical protein
MQVFEFGLAGILALDVIVLSFLAVLYAQRKDFMKLGTVKASTLTKNSKKGQVLELVARL